MSKNNGLKMKYFVLKPAGDSIYHAASRKAMRAYARHIREENPALAADLEKWAQDEALRASDLPDCPPER